MTDQETSSRGACDTAQLRRDLDSAQSIISDLQRAVSKAEERNEAVSRRWSDIYTRLKNLPATEVAVSVTALVITLAVMIMVASRSLCRRKGDESAEYCTKVLRVVLPSRHADAMWRHFVLLTSWRVGVFLIFAMPWLVLTLRWAAWLLPERQGDGTDAASLQGGVVAAGLRSAWRFMGIGEVYYAVADVVLVYLMSFLLAGCTALLFREHAAAEGAYVRLHMQEASLRAVIEFCRLQHFHTNDTVDAVWRVTGHRGAIQFDQLPGSEALLKQAMEQGPPPVAEMPAAAAALLPARPRRRRR